MSTTNITGLSASEPAQQLLIGFASLLVSCISLGFMFAPLRSYDSRDGFFVQWVQCAVVFLFGFVINVVRGSPPFNIIACIGGFLYATGNIGSVPIVSEMGIGVGMLVWGSVQVSDGKLESPPWSVSHPHTAFQIVIGWCVARFGLFGTLPQTVNSNFFNYSGLLLTLVSGVMFVFVYSSGWRRHRVHTSTHTTNCTLTPNQFTLATDNLPNETPLSTSGDSGELDRTDDSEQHPLQKTQLLSGRKLLFISFAVCLGCLHGLMMTPIVYIQDRDPAHSDNGKHPYF